MAELLAEAFPLGSWKSIIEMENDLTLAELNLLVEAMRNKEKREQKFLAALKGIDLDEKEQSDAEASFEEIKRRAAAELAGKTEEEYFFDMVGIEVETDDDDEY